MMFESNEPKDVIRSTIDRDVVAAERKAKGRPLTYFGLPGGQMLDVFEWLEFLDMVIAVERDEEEARMILWNACHQNVEDRVQVLRGEIETILIEGKDTDEVKPWKSSYDIVNLDWYSGILIKDLRGGSKKIRSVRMLFDRQEKAEQDFCLFLTVNARNKDKGEIESTLKDIRRELAAYSIDVNETIDWYMEKGIDQRLKVYVPYLLSQLSAPYRFELTRFVCISYVGTGKARMIHFAFCFKFDRKHVRTRRLDPIVLLDAPLFVIQDGTIVPSADRPPSPGGSAGSGGIG